MDKPEPDEVEEWSVVDNTLLRNGEPYKGFFYDEEIAGHNYYYNGRSMTGTTSISKLAKDWEPLLRWANKEGQAGKDHTEKRDAAGNTGKIAHQWIEKCLKEGHREKHEDKHIQKMVDNFWGWLDEEGAKVLASELKIFNGDTFVGGTIDEILLIKDEQYIGDTKTSSGIYSDFFCQMGSYLMALEWMLEHKNEPIPLFVDGVEYTNIDEYLTKLAPGVVKPVGSVIINIKKDGTFEKEADVRWSLDPERDKQFFMNTLGMYRIRSSYALQ